MRDLRLPTERPEEETRDGDRTSMSIFSDALLAFDEAELTATARRRIAALADRLKDVEGVVVIEGQTDAIGSAAYNLRLSRRRADAVERELARKVPACAPGPSGTARPARSRPTKDGRDHPEGRGEEPPGDHHLQGAPTDRPGGGRRRTAGRSGRPPCSGTPWLMSDHGFPHPGRPGARVGGRGEPWCASVLFSVCFSVGAGVRWATATDDEFRILRNETFCDAYRAVFIIRLSGHIDPRETPCEECISRHCSRALFPACGKATMNRCGRGE